MNKITWLCVFVLVIAVILPPSWQMSDEWSSSEERNGAESFASKVKRHGDGTFTSDLSLILEKEAVRQFQEWLLKHRPTQAPS